MDEPQRDYREQASIRQKRDHASEAESRAFGKRQAFGIANQRRSNGVQALHGDVFHSPKVWNPQAVLVRELTPEVFRVNLNRTHPAENTKPQQAAESASRQRFFDRAM